MHRGLGIALGAIGLLGAAACGAPAANASPHKPTPRKPNPHIAPVADAKATPAYRYGQLSQDDCEAELTARKIAFEREPAHGVLEPVRLGGPLHGVEFRTELSEKARATSPYELADCRLVLALDDFAAQLALHDIVAVKHYSIYRPPPKSWADDKIGGQHNGALAIDAAKFVKSNGKELVVDRDFHGSIGAHTCGKNASPHPVTPDATELRAILCDAVAQHLFNVILTPNHNRPHHNHFHLEVMANVTWFLAD